MNPLQPWQTSLAGVPAGLQLPVMIVVAIVLLGATAWLVKKALRREMSRGWVAPRLMRELVPGRAPKREATKVGLLGTGLALLALACAGPFWGETTRSAKRRGVDVVVALDASRSMLAQDVEPNRLTQARVAVESLIDQLHGDRIGLVTFAKDAFAQAPLTTDYAAARLYLRAVDPMQMQQGGTDVGGALRESKALLERARKGDRQQVVVLLTDGEDWGAAASDQATALGGAGIHLYTVAVGSESGGPVPELDARGRVTGMLHDEAGAPVITHANRVALAALAQEAHGQAFDLANDLGVKALATSIDTLQKSDIEDVTISTGAERFTWFALPALIMIALGLWLSPARRRRLVPALAVLALLAIPGHARADRLHVPETEAQAGADAYAAGKYDQALGHFQAKTSDPEDARFNRGDALAGLGKNDEAIEAFKTDVPALRGRDAYNRGTLEANAKHEQEAVASLRKSLVADPSNEDARHNLEVLLAKKDDQKPPDQKPEKDPKSGDKGTKDQKPGDKGDKDSKDQKPGDKGDKDSKDQKPGDKGDKDSKDQKPGDKGERGPNRAQPPGATSPRDGAGTTTEPPEPTRAERMLDALKAGDRLLPHQNTTQPERSVPDAHPW